MTNSPQNLLCVVERIGGVYGFGQISDGFFDGNYPEGSTLDVRVRGRTAYTADSWTTGFVLGGGVRAGGVVLVAALVVRTPRMTGR